MTLCIASLNLYEARATNGAVVIWEFETQKLYVLTWIDLLAPHMRYIYCRRGDDVFEIDWDMSNLVHMGDDVLRGDKLEIELHRRLQQLQMEDNLISPSGFLYDELLRGNPAPNPPVQHDLPQLESLQRFASPAQHQATSHKTPSQIRCEELLDRAALEHAFRSIWNDSEDEELQRYILSHYTEGPASSQFTLDEVQAMIIGILRCVDSLPGVRGTIVSLLQADMNATSVIQSYTRNYRPQLLSHEEANRRLYSVKPQAGSKGVKGKTLTKKNKSSPCDKCPPTPSEVEAYNNAHPQENKRYPCTVNGCSSSFSGTRWKSNLERHISTIHARLKPYACSENECLHSFAEKQDLDRHIRTAHLHLKPCPCPENGCRKSFARKRNLKRHISAVHLRLKPYPCPKKGCRDSFAEKGNLERHIRRVHMATIRIPGEILPGLA
ncbi:MAG: hypothetical protein Q9192_001594 [Flavoplaca navasiana]